MRRVVSSTDGFKDGGNGRDERAADLRDVVLEEVSVWFLLASGSGGDQHLVVNRRGGQLPTGTAGDDTG